MERSGFYAPVTLSVDALYEQKLFCTFVFLIKIMKYLKYNVLQQSEYLQNTDSLMMRCLNNSFVAVNYKALSLHAQLLPYFTHSSGSENCPLFIPYKVFLFFTALFWQDSDSVRREEHDGGVTVDNISGETWIGHIWSIDCDAV